MDSFCGAGEGIIWSVVGRRTLKKKKVESITLVFSDLCIHAWKQEAFSGVFLVACQVLTPWQTNWKDFFSSFPGQSFGEFRAARGEGRFLEGIWGHLGRTSSVWQATQKSRMCSEAGGERQGPCDTRGQSVKSPLCSEQLRWLPAASLPQWCEERHQTAPPETAALLPASPIAHPFQPPLTIFSAMCFGLFFWRQGFSM